MNSNSDRKGLSLSIRGTVAKVRPHVQEAFKNQGFGVLTEIDVQATLHQKVGAEMDGYLILGMCNPTLAHRAIQIDPNIGQFLPCNVLLRQDGDQVEVIAQDPALMMQYSDSAGLEPIGLEARTRIENAISEIKTN